ncbi:hypothetical protein SAMN06296036_1461 [Pseudobacteriovorax antillogorgiicola]|uniref:Uncharacterized protein n=1 Tax=Pseudobacteriovorax antillogorgiicola TaxID=1513793 RepID=A0A1Y6CR93_9BACT|nr:hypothetical protein SAMN06296036_1461 [Pseudobacteriovorax antillogorgiicola]
MILCHFETFHYRANIILIYRQICLTLPWHIAKPIAPSVPLTASYQVCLVAGTAMTTRM